MDSTENGIATGMLTSSLFETAFAASVGASCTALVATPLDVVKTRMQAHVCDAGVCVDQAHFGGPLDGMRKIWRMDGTRALWRGLNVTLTIVVPSTAVYFTAYDGFSKFLRSRLSLEHTQATLIAGLLCQLTNSPIVVSLLAGTGAGSVAALITTPADVIKTRRQAIQLSAAESKFADRTFLASLRHVATEEGLLSLMTGAGPRLAKVAPSCAIMMGCYELVKQIFQELRHLRMSSS